MNIPCIPSRLRSHKSTNSRPTRKDPAWSVTEVSIRPGPIQARQPPSQASARTAPPPLNNTQPRMANHPGVAMETQMAMRPASGSATPPRITAQSRLNHATASTAARADGTRSIRLQEDDATQGRMPGFERDIARDQIAEQVRVRQFEKLLEGGAFVAGGGGMVFPEVTQQQKVELLHAAPAAPFELPHG
jgi:hypothetical protein